MRGRLPYDLTFLSNWLRTAKESKSIVYYIGHIAFDANVDNAQINGIGEIAKIRNLMLYAQEHGFVRLMQRRVEHQFEYIATRTRKRWHEDRSKKS